MGYFRVCRVITNNARVRRYLRLPLNSMLALLCLCTTAHADTKLQCYEEPGTRKTTCIAPSLVRANGDVRSSPLYMGGPNRVTSTSYTFIADCKKGISTLQDSSGVNFGGNFSSATDGSRALSEWICEVPKPKQDSRLRQIWF